MCISQEGNINQIWYPDLAHTHLAFDGYCLGDVNTFDVYRDLSPGSGVTNTGFGPAVLTLGPSSTTYNPITVTRTTLDGKYRLVQYIKVSLQSRSIFVGMTVTNVDPSGNAHNVFGLRFAAPAIDGSAADDQYNEFGQGGTLSVSGEPPFGATGQALQAPGPGSNSFLFGPTQQGGVVLADTVADFNAINANNCNFKVAGSSGPLTGGNRVFVGLLSAHQVQWVPHLAFGESASVGKFVYRMV